MLITLKHNPSSEAAIVEKAGEALKNLEKCPKNVGIMAENGLLDPLLENLIDGMLQIICFGSQWVRIIHLNKNFD